MTNRQAYEAAAGYNICDTFFIINGIDPDAEYPTMEVSSNVIHGAY